MKRLQFEVHTSADRSFQFTPGTGKQASSPPHTEAEAKPTPLEKAGGVGTDGTNEAGGEYEPSSTTDSGTSSPTYVNDGKPASPARSSTFASRSASPGPMTGGGLGGRAASPISFGYPYHHSARDGYLSDSPAPTAIQG